MMRLLIFLALCVSAIAQPLTVNDVAFVSTFNIGSAGTTPFSPTNINTLISWWIADNAQTNTSSQITNIPDSWVNGHDLTNRTAAKMPYLTNNYLNGHAIAGWDLGGDRWLKSMTYTASWPHEVWVFANHYATNANGGRYYFDGQYASNRHFVLTQATGGFPMNEGAPTVLASTSYLSNFFNKWIAWTFVFNGANSSILSNVVSVGAGNTGSNNMDGFVLGNSYLLASGAYPHNFAELFTFSATNSYENRSNCFWYLTNK